MLAYGQSPELRLRYSAVRRSRMKPARRQRSAVAPAPPPVAEGQRFARAGAFIFLAALTVRLVHIWQIKQAPFFSVLMGDAHGYDDWAQQIARGDWIGRDVFYQAPLYPYFLGAIYALAGRDLVVVR